MADPKDTKDYKNDPARTKPYEFKEVRPQAEIVAQAYDHEQPTPTQEENDQAKLAALNLTPPEGGEQAKKKTVEPKPGGGYQTRASAPTTAKAD